MTITETIRTTITSEVPARPVVSATIASLPERYAWADATATGSADVTVVDGRDGWVDRASSAVSAGAATVVVLEPSIAAGPAVRALADAAESVGTVVVIADPFAGNAALPAAQEAASVDLAVVTSVFLTAVTDDVRRAQLEQLRILRSLGFGDVNVHRVFVTERSAVLVASGFLDGRSVVVRGLVGRSDAVPRSHTVRAYGPDRVVAIDLPDADTARPAAVTITRPDAGVTVPTIWERSQRSVLRRIATDGPAGLPDARGLAYDLDVLPL